MPQQQPQTDGHQQHTGVLADQRDPEGCPSDPPAATFHQAEHQDEHGQGQLAEVGVVPQRGADQGIAGKEAVGEPVGSAFRQQTQGQSMQCEASRRDQSHLHQGQGGTSDQPQKGCPEQESGGEMLAKSFVVDRGQLSGVDHIGGELRGEGAFKWMTLERVPEHLLKDSLVVTGQQHPGPPGLQRQQDGCEENGDAQDPGGHGAHKGPYHCGRPPTRTNFMFAANAFRRVL